MRDSVARDGARDPTGGPVEITIARVVSRTPVGTGTYRLSPMSTLTTRTGLRSGPPAATPSPGNEKLESGARRRMRLTPESQ